MKKQRKIEKDNRGVAIYARKSRITNKGDSIGVQFKQCADYAKKELGLDEEYEFLQYEDKGLSGYFSDRPDFQRMLHDVQDGKIKAIVCYKLDRVGRKTADLIRLMDFLEMYHVNLLICSNGINTASGLYKIFIQIFAVIAEFERDTLTERIVDNMMELAKDGRWLGGNTPMGFTVRRVITGSGKGKSAYSYLESLPEEKRMVQRLYEIFRTTRSIQTTAKQMNEEGFHTPSGAAFNASTTRLVLRNPIYCTADKRSYDYFIDHDGNVFGDAIEFDGTHGLSAYNKTDQEKYEGSDSTFISPKYVQTIESKPVSEWIIAVGRHEGFIPSEQWIEVQELLDAIAEKYNRPHRKTNALLAGLAHCPHCGRRLSVISESDRWTNGKPRFKYVCPGYRKKECNFKAVDGVLLDEFVVQQLSELSDENSERFRSILEIKIEEVLEQSQTVQEHNIIKKKRDKLKADIAAQTRNLREADGSIKQFIQEDLQNLAEELREAERQISKLDEGRKNNMIAIRDLEMTKERLLSFAEYAKDAQPEVLVTLIQTIVERIYIVDKNDERYCHIFIKGCTDEDYTGFFQTAGYIEQKTTPVCDSEQYCISKMIWDILLEKGYSYINYAEAVYSPNGSATPKHCESSLIYYLKRNDWVPDINGRLFKPGDIDIDKINKSFKYDDRNKLLKALGFGSAQSLCENFQTKVNEFNDMMSKNGYDEEWERVTSDEKEFLKQYRKNKKSEKKYLQTQSLSLEKMLAKQTRIEKDGSTKLTDETFIVRSTSSTLKDIEKTILNNEKMPGRIVKYFRKIDTSSKEERAVLMRWYNGKCQMCGARIIKYDKTPYFEAKNIINNQDVSWKLDKSIPLGWNSVCLCPNCAVRYSVCTKDITTLYNQIMSRKVYENQESPVQLAIQLDGGVQYIKYAPDHFRVLQEVCLWLDKMDKDSESES